MASLNIMIDEHIGLLNSALKITLEGLNELEVNDYSSITDTYDNRQRVINLINNKQREIEDYLHNLPKTLVNKPLIAKVKNWFDQMNDLITQITTLDQKIVDKLENHKDETIREIAQVFKSKEAFEGYNLSNVK